MICPECRVGKHDNCDGTTWDEVTDAPATCPCYARGHAEVTREDVDAALSFDPFFGSGP